LQRVAAATGARGAVPSQSPRWGGKGGKDVFTSLLQ